MSPTNTHLETEHTLSSHADAGNSVEGSKHFMRRLILTESTNRLQAFIPV